MPPTISLILRSVPQGRVSKDAQRSSNPRSKTLHNFAFPAKAGTHSSAPETVDKWIPACAGNPA